MELTKSEIIKNNWLKVWTYYQNIKKIYNLTSYDILKQLDASCDLTYREYLSINSSERYPCTKRGTVGRKLWAILLPGLVKNDWLPSTSGYNEKLEENICNGMYLQYPDKKYLEKLFTIDELVPKIRNVSYYF